VRKILYTTFLCSKQFFLGLGDKSGLPMFHTVPQFPASLAFLEKIRVPRGSKKRRRPNMDSALLIREFQL